MNPTDLIREKLATANDAIQKATAEAELYRGLLEEIESGSVSRAETSETPEAPTPGKAPARGEAGERLKPLPAILLALAVKPLRTSELTEAVGFTQPTINKAIRSSASLFQKDSVESPWKLTPLGKARAESLMEVG